MTEMTIVLADDSLVASLQRLLARKKSVLSVHVTPESPVVAGGWTLDRPDLPYNPATDNPSPSKDPYWDIAENRAAVAEGVQQAHNGEGRIRTLDEIRLMMGL